MTLPALWFGSAQRLKTFKFRQCRCGGISLPNRFKTTNPAGRSKGRRRGPGIREPESRGKGWTHRRARTEWSPLTRLVAEDEFSGSEQPCSR
jgi:hypothetical protein